MMTIPGLGRVRPTMTLALPFHLLPREPTGLPSPLMPILHRVPITATVLATMARHPSQSALGASRPAIIARTSTALSGASGWMALARPRPRTRPSPNRHRWLWSASVSPVWQQFVVANRSDRLHKQQIRAFHFRQVLRGLFLLLEAIMEVFLAYRWSFAQLRSFLAR